MQLATFVRKYGNEDGNPETPWAGANGVYVVSPSCPAQFWEGERCGNNTPKNVKIGKASGFHGFASADGSKGRLRHYRTYWPNGVTVHAVLITPSFATTVHTIKDNAVIRETTLRRIFKKRKLTGFGANGRGGSNGTDGLGSEWIHLPPGEIMNYLIAAGPMTHPTDKLYDCRKNACERVNLNKVSRNATRLMSVVKALEYVSEDNKSGKRVGIKGRPVVLPRTIVEAAREKKHPLHKYAHRLKANVNLEYRGAEQRVAQKKQNKIRATEIRLNEKTRGQKLAKQKKLDTLKKREPRNLAAIRRPYGVLVAEARKALQAKKSPAKRTRPFDNKEVETMKRHPNHRVRYNIEKNAAARLLFGTNPNASPPGSPNSGSPCDTAVKVLHRYPNYTYYDVTGDGRCYFYAIIKALGLPLRNGVGEKKNTNHFVEQVGYFNPTRRQYWKNELKAARWHDPINVLVDSIELTRALRNQRGIIYIAKVNRTRRDLGQVHKYMLDPIYQVRQSTANGVYKIQENGELHLVAELTGKLRSNINKEKADDFKKAFREGRVVTFIWRNIPGEPNHYEIIVPKRLSTSPPDD